MRIFLFGILGVLMAACGSSHSHKDKMIFRYNEASGITSLDPIKANNLSNIWAVQQLFNGLVQLDSTMTVQPCIAQSWELANNGTTYRFFLRRDVYFHEDACFPAGARTVDALDVCYSFDRIVQRGGPQWVFAQVQDLPDGGKSFFAENDSVVRIELKQPFGQFLQVLTMPYCYIVAKEAVEYYGEDFGRNPVGTGPFQLRKWHESEKLVLNRNERYFEFELDRRLPFLDGVSITFVKDRQTAFLELSEGRIDFISGLDPAYKDELLTPEGELNPYYSKRLYLQKIPFLNTEYLGVHLDHPELGPLADANVRKALSVSIDRQKLITYIRNGIGIPATQFVPYALLNRNNHPPEKNRRKQIDSLLALTEFRTVGAVPSIKLYTDVAYVDLCTAILNQWNEFGFKVSLEVLDRPTLKSQVAKGQLPFFRASWIADYPDAENYLTLFYSPNFSPGGPNYTHFHSLSFDRLYQSSMNEDDPSERVLIYAAMDSIVISEMPVIPLFFDEVSRFVNHRVSGLPAHPMNHLDLRRVRISSTSH